MKRLIWTVLVILGLAGIAGPDAGYAQGIPPRSATSASAGSGPATDSGIGGYAAVGCGIFGRALGSGMVNVGTIAGAIATCGYMLIDALLFER
jgi:hypothetical protein